MPAPIGAGSTRSPTVARNGLPLPIVSTAVADAGGPLDADHRRLAEPDLEAEVVGQRRLDDLLLHLAVERHDSSWRTSSWRRLISGSCSASWASAACSAPFSARPRGHDDRLQRRRGEVVLIAVAAVHADLVADPDAAETPDLGDLAGGDRRALDGVAVVRTRGSR